MYSKARLTLALLAFLNCLRLPAHDVVWPGNPDGFNPSVPLQIEFGTTALIQVKPVTGESCIVAVNLDMIASTLVGAEIITDNPAKEVDILVTPLRAATSPSETAKITGEWHATGVPDPQECTAVNPNPFTVTVQVIGGPPVSVVTSISSQAGVPGSVITIQGTGFTGASLVTFGGTDTAFTVVDDRTIRATVPADARVGKIAITTPGGVVESEAVFVVLPELKVMRAPDSPVVQVQWNDRNYPFTLQRSSSLQNAAWTDLIITLEHNLAIPIDQELQFYRLSWMEIPLDRTDYNRDRAAVAAFYNQDPVAYWASFGIPALARLAVMRQNLNIDPWSPFEGFLQAFDPNRFLTALEQDELLAPIGTLVADELAKNSNPTNAFLKSLVTLVSDDAATNCPGTFRTNCFVTNSYSSLFVNVMTNTMTTNNWSAWAPQTNKTFINPAVVTNYGPNWIDLHGSDAFATNNRPAPRVNDDTNTNFHIAWGSITAATIWNTTYDGACATVAVGASLAKLGVISTNTTCQFWNDLSHLLGATPGQLGAFPSNIAAFYGTLGYGCTEAYDGRFESAVEEAKKALERGCDVQIDYYSPDRTRGHTEMVTGITLDPNNSQKATISTLSWGSGATVTYTGASSGGSFSGKSDGQMYRKPNETTSYLEQTGISVIRYYCKQ